MKLWAFFLALFTATASAQPAPIPVDPLAALPTENVGKLVVGTVPVPPFIIKNDAALDCAFCVRRLVYDAINPELELVGLPPIDVRLGLDGGEAAIVVLGSDKTKRHADLIGDVVSLACKIESRAGTGEIFLGETVHRNLHFSWRELCAPVDLTDWTYSVCDSEPYPLFRLDPTGTRPVERPPRRQ